MATIRSDHEYVERLAELVSAYDHEDDAQERDEIHVRIWDLLRELAEGKA